MELTNQQLLPVSQAQAWEALNDIALLQSAIPGCDSMTAIGEQQYEVLITAAIGPVKAKFKGKLQLEDLQPPTSYRLRFDQFEPRAAGIKAMLPFVDRFLPTHNLQSLAELVDVLAERPPPRAPGRATSPQH